MSAEIWAIGGGKGGTGKSFIISGLAVHLANQGKKVTLIDADLGGANLHSILKINKPHHSLSDFFEQKVTLKELIEETPIPNLKLIIGDIRTLNPDTVSYAHRLKLYRQIKNIGGDYVLIDLGAGSSIATLDTYLLADKMITVTLPEITSIDNLYHFLKKLLFRKLNLFLAEHDLKDAAKYAWQNRQSYQIKTIKQLIDYFRDKSPAIRDRMRDEFSRFNLNVVINQVRHAPHLHAGNSIKSVIIKYFGIHAQFAGYLTYSDTVWRYVNEDELFLKTAYAAPVLEELRTVAQHIIGNTPISFTESDREAQP